MKEIVLVALIATSQVTESPQHKIVEGGDLALQATQMCIDDERDIYQGFILSKDIETGSIEVNCQILKTTTGDYYAAKGVYRDNGDLYNYLLNNLKQHSERK